MQGAMETRPEPVTLRHAFWVWWRFAMLSFGGPAGQIAVMHRILVDEKHWIGSQRFLHARNMVRIGGRALTTTPSRLLAVVAFVLIFFLGAPFPLIVLGAGLIGWWSGRQARSGRLTAPRSKYRPDIPATILMIHARPRARSSPGPLVPGSASKPWGSAQA